MLYGMAKSLALQHVDEYHNVQVLTGVPDAVLRSMRPNLLPCERLAGPLNLDSLEQARE